MSVVYGLANFGVTMVECMEMAELDWEFHINNQALLEATAKWRAKPSALKPIDNFWAPGMQSRGKRKRIIVDDDENGGTEDPLQLDVASQAVLEVISSTAERTTGQASEDNPSRVKLFRSKRNQTFKRLRLSEPSHRVFTAQSTQDFSMTDNNNVTAEEQSDLVRKTNQCANKYAADLLIARLEEQFNIDGAAQISGMEVGWQSTDAANIVEEISAGSNRREERRHEKNNAHHFRQRTAKKNKRSAHLSKSLDAISLEPIQLIMGREKDSIQDDNNSHGQHIAWAHRTILGQTTRSAQ